MGDGERRDVLSGVERCGDDKAVGGRASHRGDRRQPHQIVDQGVGGTGHSEVDGGGAFGEVVEGVAGQQLAVVDDHHPIAEELDLLEHMGGEQHGGVAVGQLTDEGADLGALRDVEAAHRLVEDEHFGRVHQRLGEPHPLAEPLREVVDDAVSHLVQAHSLDHPVGRAGWIAHSLNARHIRQVSAHGHLGVQRETLGQVAHHRLHLVGPLEDVVPPDVRSS